MLSCWLSVFLSHAFFFSLKIQTLLAPSWPILKRNDSLPVSVANTILEMLDLLNCFQNYARKYAPLPAISEYQLLLTCSLLFRYDQSILPAHLYLLALTIKHRTQTPQQNSNSNPSSICCSLTCAVQSYAGFPFQYVCCCDCVSLHDDCEKGCRGCTTLKISVSKRFPIFVFIIAQIRTLP